jgi:hypothetical protein
MSTNHDERAPTRREYTPPAVERVVLDPIREMLQSCAIDGNSKLSGKCASPVNFS